VIQITIWIFMLQTHSTLLWNTMHLQFYFFFFFLSFLLFFFFPIFNRNVPSQDTFQEAQCITKL